MRAGRTGNLNGALAAVCIAALASLAMAEAAAADTYKGRTTQGKTMKLTVNNAGEVRKASYVWDMECRGGGSLTNGGTISSRFRRSSPRGFNTKGGYTAEVERKFEAQVKVRLDGDRASDTRFTGSFKLTAKVFNERTDELVARCATGIVRWTADLKGPPPAQPPASPRFRR